MKYFIRNTLIFLVASFCITAGLIFILNQMVLSNDYFKLKKGTKYIVVGHSHPEFAFNDTLISDFENYAQSAESYYYSFIKIKKIVEANRQIKTIFIEYSNNQIIDEMNLWVWGDECLSYRYPKYSSLMSIKDIGFLFLKNFKSVLSSQSLSLKANLFFLIKDRMNYPKYQSWGGYLYLVRDKTEDILKSSPDTIIRNVVPKLSETNLEYLRKTIDFCTANGIKVYLTRCPLHSKCPFLANELTYKKILKTCFSDVEYLDFKNFPSKNSEFGDLQHLNHKGAKKFSLFFNRLLELNLLKKDNKQEFINKEIQRLEEMP